MEKEVKPEGEIGFKTIEGGKYAIFSNWLPNSPYQLRDAPSFESYINDPGVRKEEEYETLLYIPIQ